MFASLMFSVAPYAVHAKAKTGTNLDVELESGDSTKVSRAIGRIQKGLKSKDIRILVARIHNGLPIPLLKEAVSALGRVGGADARKELVALMQHRDPLIRQEAIANVAITKHKAAVSAVAKRLDDVNPKVRAEKRPRFLRSGKALP